MSVRQHQADMKAHVKEEEKKRNWKRNTHILLILKKNYEFLAFSWSVCRRNWSGRKEFIFLQEENVLSGDLKFSFTILFNDGISLRGIIKKENCKKEN